MSKTGGGILSASFLSPAEERIVGILGEASISGVVGGIDTSAFAKSGLSNRLI